MKIQIVSLGQRTGFRSNGFKGVTELIENEQFEEVARPVRFELTTYSSGGCRSIHLSYGRTIVLGKATETRSH